MGPDRLPVIDIIVFAINYIAKDSMETGCVPEVLKVGWITPIWKGEDSSNPINYRPISLTSHLSKVIERVVRQEMTAFLDSNHLIEDSQHGSRSGRGTMSQLIKQHDMLVDS